MECESCGHELKKAEMLEELAERRGWTEGTEYTVNEQTYGSDTINVKKPGVEDLLREERAKDRSTADQDGGSSA